MKNLRQFLILLIVITISFFSSCSKKGQSSQSEKPNIIFIMADDMGYGDLGCYGQEKIKSPNIDQLAKEGLRFTQCYAGATVCAPSRSVLMTGQHTGHTRVRDNKCKVGGTTTIKNNREIRRMNLLDEDVTVAQILRKAGYRTGLVGKWHLGGYNPDAGPLKRGFDEFYGKLTRTKHMGRYWPQKWFNNEALIDITENQNGAKGYYLTHLNTDNAIKYIERNQHDAFFLYLAFGNPHSPYQAPDLGPYADKDWALEEKTYAAMIHHLDLSVGRVMETLKNLDLDKKTIVFFCSDNGPRSESEDIQTRVINFFESNGPLKGYNRDMYEGGIRVPMVVRWPGQVPMGETSDAIWYFADFLSTVAELAAVVPPENIDGISILNSLYDENQLPPDRFLYWEFHQKGFHQAVRWKQWKAIRDKPGEHLLLFDLSEDKGEENNIAQQHPEIIEQFETYLKTARTDSPNWPILEN